MNGMRVGEKIKKLRIQAGVSATKLGQAVGRSPTTIIEIEEGGTRDPKLSIVRGIADFLHVSMDWLTDDSADCPPPETNEQQTADLIRNALAGAGLAGEQTDDERELLAAWRRLNDRRRGELLGLARGWSGSDSAGDNSRISPSDAARRTAEIADRPGSGQSRKDTG